MNGARTIEEDAAFLLQMAGRGTDSKGKPEHIRMTDSRDGDKFYSVHRHLASPEAQAHVRGGATFGGYLCDGELTRLVAIDADDATGLATLKAAADALATLGARPLIEKADLPDGCEHAGGGKLWVAFDAPVKWRDALATILHHCPELEPFERFPDGKKRVRLPGGVYRRGLNVPSGLSAWPGNGHWQCGAAAIGLIRANVTPASWVTVRAQPERAKPPVAGPIEATIGEGARNEELLSLAGTMRRRGMVQPAILAALLAVNAAQCDPPLNEAEVRDIASRYAEQQPAANASKRVGLGGTSGLAARREKPHLGDEALYGLAGDIVNAISPHTEASKPALLFSFLTLFGNCAGPTAHARVGGTRHPLKLYTVLVGPSNSGRKGTAVGDTLPLFYWVDAAWHSGCRSGGFSSGEGVVYHLRDARGNDEGVSDKRLLSDDSELGGMLDVMSRPGNTLSARIREAFDCKPLRNTTKNDPNVALEHHLSILGNVTVEELLKKLTDTQAANGFGNRFLWVYSERDKLLPKADTLANYGKFAERVSTAMDFARQMGGPIARTAQAEKLWAEAYPTLASGGPGLYGKITGRAEPLTLRLSVLYAVLDRSEYVRPEHLTAALACWQYAKDSARYIFGNRRGDAIVADCLLHIEAAGRDGISRTALRDCFHRNLSASTLNAALLELIEEDSITETTMKTPGADKPTTIYLLKEYS